MAKYSYKQKEYHRNWYHTEMGHIKCKPPFNGECYVCKEDDLDVLLFHHVFFNGQKHRQEYTSRRTYYRSFRKPDVFKRYPIQLVCHNCHKKLHRGAKGK